MSDPGPWGSGIGCLRPTHFGRCLSSAAIRWAARFQACESRSASFPDVRIATGKVVRGKLELDGDSLEEGSTVTVLVPELDETFELTPDEEVALEKSLEQAARGQFVDAANLLRELRQ